MHREVPQNLVLEVFDVPIAFHRCLVKVTGSINAALMLSHAITTSERLAEEHRGWFTLSTAQWETETGLSRWEQQTARRALRQCQFIDERVHGLPPTVWFRVKADRIWNALQARYA